MGKKWRLHYLFIFATVGIGLSACDSSVPPTPTEEVIEGAVVELEYVQDPAVLLLGEDGEWDSGVLRFPYVVEHEGSYHMFYEARAEIGTLLAIGYATSEDGISWTKYANNPLFEGDGDGFDSLRVARPVVMVGNDGTWTMYYTGSGGEEDNKGIGIATASSPTGPWLRNDTPLLERGPEGAWDHELILMDQLVVLDGEFRMYYSGREKSGRSAMIGMATSTDGITWEKYNDPTNDGDGALFAESDPVLLAGPGWDASATWTPNIFFEDGQWLMLYNGFGNIGAATSEDGITWTKHEDNPIYKNGRVFHPFILEKEDGTYWIYFRKLNNDSIFLLQGTIQVK